MTTRLIVRIVLALALSPSARPRLSVETDAPCPGVWLACGPLDIGVVYREWSRDIEVVAWWGLPRGMEVGPSPIDPRIAPR